MARMLTGVLLGMAILLLCGPSGRHAAADPKPTEKHGTRVALVDMAKIFKSSMVFLKRREALTLELSESEETAKTLQAALVQMKSEHDRLEAGSEDRVALEQRMKTKTDEFNKFRDQGQRMFRKKEAEIYLHVYELTSDEIAKYARERGIDLVIRFNSEPLERDDPAKLLNSMNRMVVYENGLDITDEIITAIN